MLSSQRNTDAESEGYGNYPIWSFHNDTGYNIRFGSFTLYFRNMLIIMGQLKTDFQDLPRMTISILYNLYIKLRSITKDSLSWEKFNS